MVSTALLVLAVMVPSQADRTLADPRPTSAVADTTGTLSAAERRAIDDAANRVRVSGKGELLVVVVHSIQPAKPRTWATALFNRWRIGKASRNDGVLLFAALDDHAAELILGSGVDGREQVAASEAIMREVIVPRFRAGKPGEALLQGAWAAGERILGVPLGPLQPESSADAPTAGADAAPAVHAADTSAPPADAAAPAAAPETAEPASRTEEATDDVDARTRNLGLGGGALGLVGLIVGRLWWRRRARICPSCKRPMVRLGEVEDDAYLAAGEQAEERLGSVDYDVWHCAQCNTATKVRWGAFFTRYGRCPSCQNKTRSSTTTTLQSATEYSEGLVRVEEDCQFCSYRRSYTRSTPRISSSSSSSSSSSFSSGGSSGGGSSGSGASGSW